MTHLDDDLLTALRGARPGTGDQPSAASPEATATLIRILQTPRTPVRRRNHTRRRFLLAGIPATAAIAAAAVAAVTLTSPGKAPGTNPTASSVRAAVLDAFQKDSGDIMYTAQTIKLARGGVLTQREWMYPAFATPGQQVRYRLFSLNNGAPSRDSESIYTQNAAATHLRLSTTQGPRSAEVTDVEYATKTWSRARTSTFPLGLDLSPALVRSQIASGNFAVAGKGQVQGRQALKLIWRTSFSSMKAATTLWVDAKTYQPLRTSSSLRVGAAPFQTSTAQYQILAATPANLGLLTPPIPAGFTHTATPHYAIRR